MSEKLSEKGWAIIGTHGFYIGWWFLKREAISSHCKSLGSTWGKCRKRGDSVVKISIQKEGDKL